MTAPLLTTRDRLAKGLHDIDAEDCCDWPCATLDTAYYQAQADALLASGAVVDVATLAGDEALVERVAARVSIVTRETHTPATLAALADELGSDG